MTFTAAVAGYWDVAADSFDQEVDHGLLDPPARKAWADRLHSWLPEAPSDVLDLGCGTGSLAMVMAEQGHRVVGVDLSPRMVEKARAKLAGTNAVVLVADAAEPPVGERVFDVVLARHLLWTLPDPHAALARWALMVRPGGLLVLVEGRWNAPGGPAYIEGAETLPWMGGVGAADLVVALQPLTASTEVDPLPDPALWGREIDDERYAVIARVR